MRTVTTRFIFGAQLFLTAASFAQSLDENALVAALQEGGYILVMRHASSPRQAPTAAEANHDNRNRERQLDATGRSDALAMGASIRRLGISITEILSSPAYRTLETALLAGFEEVQVRDYLGNQGMLNSSQAFADQLLDNLKNPPPLGNRLLITHSPNIARALPGLSLEVEQGEVLVIDPEQSVAEPIARIPINQWSRLRLP